MDNAAIIRIKTILLASVAFLLIATIVLALDNINLKTPAQKELVQLNDGWTISRGGNNWTPDDATAANIGIADKDDVIVLTRVLPQSTVSPASLSFKTILSTVDVSVDNVKIYSFGYNYLNAGYMLPKMVHYVPLPDHFSGKEIQITITAREDNAFSGLSPFWLGDYGDIFNLNSQSKIFPMTIGVFLIVLGFLLLILSPLLIFSAHHDYSITLAAFTSWMLGSYIMCYNDVFWLFTDSPAFYTFAEYFSLYMIPALILGFLLATRQSTFKIIGNILFLANLIFAFGTSLLHLLGYMHICNFVGVLHILGIFEGIFVIVSLVVSAVKSIKGQAGKIAASTGVLIIGLFIFTTCCIIDVVKFNLMKFSLSGEINSQINFMTIGALLFMMCLLLNYFYHCIEFISESTIKTHLEGLAYTDPLTGLQNRAKCETVLAELNGQYTIISLDLDYLKYTNDNYGHDQGDTLLKGFSDILRNTFTDALLVGRMGGDEFIVVLPFVDEERTDRDLSCLSDLLAHRNSQESRLRFSASWGYATNLDKEFKQRPTAQAVYLLADQRMYYMKSRHHKESLGRLYDDLLGKILDKGGAK